MLSMSGFQNQQWIRQERMPQLDQTNSNTSTQRSGRSTRSTGPKKTKQPAKPPQKKQPIGQIPKEEKTKLWTELASYIEALLASSKVGPKRRKKYSHPPEIEELFERLGLRAPKTQKGLANLHMNFVQKIKILNPAPSNSQQQAKNQQSVRPQRRWQPKSGISQQRSSMPPSSGRGQNLAQSMHAQFQQYGQNMAQNQMQGHQNQMNGMNQMNQMGQNQGGWNRQNNQSMNMNMNVQMAQNNRQQLQHTLPSPQNRHGQSQSMGAAAIQALTRGANNNLNMVNMEMNMGGNVGRNGHMHLNNRQFAMNAAAQNYWLAQQQEIFAKRQALQVQQAQQQKMMQQNMVQQAQLQNQQMQNSQNAQVMLQQHQQLRLQQLQRRTSQMQQLHVQQANLAQVRNSMPPVMPSGQNGLLMANRNGQPGFLIPVMVRNPCHSASASGPMSMTPVLSNGSNPNTLNTLDMNSLLTPSASPNPNSVSNLSSIPLPMTPSPKPILQVTVPAALSPPAVVSPTGSGAPLSLRQPTMERIDENVTSPQNGGGLWYNDVVSTPEPTPVQSPVTGLGVGLNNYGRLNYPNYPPTMLNEMRESHSGWTFTSTQQMNSFVVGVKNAQGTTALALFLYLQAKCAHTVLLVDLDLIASRSVSLNSIGLKESGLLNRVSINSPTPGTGMNNNNRYSAISTSLASITMTPQGPHHMLQYTGISEISEIGNIDDVELPGMMPMGPPAIPESKSMLSQLNIDIAGINQLNSPMSPQPVDNKPVLSTDQKSSSGTGSGTSRYSQIVQAPNSRRSDVSKDTLTNSIQSNRNSMMSPRVSGAQTPSLRALPHVPHNDLNALFLFEPSAPFETLKMFQSRTNPDDEELHGKLDSFRTTVTNALQAMTSYLDHRIKSSHRKIELVYFVSHAMPRPGKNVCPKWFEWSQARKDALSECITNCGNVCRESQMQPKFYSCTTPSPVKPPPGMEGSNIYSKEEDYFLPREDYEETTLRFQARDDIVMFINQTFLKKRATESAATLTLT